MREEAEGAKSMETRREKLVGLMGTIIKSLVKYQKATEKIAKLVVQDLETYASLVTSRKHEEAAKYLGDLVSDCSFAATTTVTEALDKEEARQRYRQRKREQEELVPNGREGEGLN
jgi:hypothetical protein